jgi:hypothetical protein
LQESVGHFAVGLEFNALLVDAGVPGGPFDVVREQPLLLLEQL